MNIYLVTGKGNNSNNIPFAYSLNKEKASIYANEIDKDSQYIRVQKCTDVTLLVLLDKYFLINLDK
jgi:hypothetical protein